MANSRLHRALTFASNRTTSSIVTNLALATITIPMLMSKHGTAVTTITAVATFLLAVNLVWDIHTWLSPAKTSQRSAHTAPETAPSWTRLFTNLLLLSIASAYVYHLLAR